MSLVTAPLLENSSQAPQQEQHEVTVTLKLIQVYVPDKGGKSAMDLELEDFELFDNGKKKELTEFEKYRLSVRSLYVISEDFI